MKWIAPRINCTVLVVLQDAVSGGVLRAQYRMEKYMIRGARSLHNLYSLHVHVNCALVMMLMIIEAYCTMQLLRAKSPLWTV